MCFQYLNKFFGRRANAQNAATGDVSPRPSLSVGPQVSIETVGTSKSAKSIKSSNASAGKRAVSLANVNNKMEKLDQTPINLGLEGRPPVATGSGGGAQVSNATAAVASTAAAASVNVVATSNSSAGSAAVSGAGDNGSPGKRSSWWGFFGIGKKSKSSNDSL